MVTETLIFIVKPCGVNMVIGLSGHQKACTASLSHFSVIATSFLSYAQS